MMNLRLVVLLLSILWVSLSPANIVAGKFHVTVDFNDDFRKAGGSVKPENIDQLMDRFAELGITRVYWIHNAEDFFLPKPLTDPKVDLLARAVEAAHRNGMELYASYKVFETGRSGVALPQNISLPSSKRYIDGISGHYPITWLIILTQETLWGDARWTVEKVLVMGCWLRRRVEPLLHRL